MKKKSCLAFILSASCLLGASGLSSCQKQAPATTSESSVSEASLTLDQTSLSLEVGGTATLKATLTGSTDAITWLSKDPTIATVADGVVTALKEGNVIIKALAGKKEALCQVTVTAKALEKLLSINLAEDSYTLYETLTSQVAATVLYGDDPVAATLTYTIANTAVATIDSTGLITGVKAGSTTLTVAATYEGKSDSISVNLVVLALNAEISAKFTSRDVDVGTPLPLSFEITYGGATLSGDFTYTYSFLAGHTGEAKVENDALVGVKAGEVVLQVSTTYKEKTISATFTFTIHQLCSVVFQSEGQSIKELSVMDGSTLQAQDLPADPTLSGYFFKGWVDASGAAFDLTSKIPGSETLSASWYRLVDESVKGTIQKDFHLFQEGKDTITVGTGATFGGFANGGGTINGLSANTTTSFSFPALDFASAISRGGEISFDLYSSWKEYTIAGCALPYEAEHNASDPYHIMIKPNGVGYGIYASALNEGHYGEIGTLPADVASGKAPLTIGITVYAVTTAVTFSKLSVYGYDYQAALASELTALSSSPSAKGLAAYESTVKENFTPYETSVYVEPALVSSAKTSLAGQSNVAFTLPTETSYFTDTHSMRSQSAEISLYNDGYNAIGSASDSDYYAWVFQTTSGATSAFLELPLLAYSLYSEVTFKMWMSSKASFSLNGTQLEAASDCANHQWNYVLQIVTTGKSSILSVYHGDGSYGIYKPSGTPMVMATYTLPEDVANGRTPLHFTQATSTAWSGTTEWGLTNIIGTF